MSVYCCLCLCSVVLFMSLQLLKEIKAVNFTVNTTQIFFDSNGDPRLGYDVVLWDIDKSKQRTHIKVIGEYWPGGDIEIPDDLVEKKVNVTVRLHFHHIFISQNNE